MNYKVLIVDDESLARQRLLKMLESIEGFDAIDEARNGQEAVEKVQKLEPDIVLLDVRMPGMDGMEAAKLIQEQGLKATVIFTTAYDEYAIKAFDVNAQGYLLKPIQQEKLEHTLQQIAQQKPPGNSRTHLSASARGSVQLIALKDVRVLQAEHKYVTVYHTGGESIIDESLKSLETQFPELFKRVHRNALVSCEHISAMEKNAEGQYVLRIADTDIMPTVSRRLVSDVRQWMKHL